MTIRLEDCTTDQRRLLLAMVALDKAPTDREADARKASASREGRNEPATHRRAA